MANSKFLCLIFLLVNVCFAAVKMVLSGVATPPGPAMFVLGDSSVDCGDNNPFNGLFHRNLSRFPCNGSDTTLLPQLLAKKMRLPYTTPFYSQNGSINRILDGLNFGSAEASILSSSSRNYQSLNQQLRQAVETIQLLQLQLGESTADTFINSSIFYLSFGKDDFIDFFHGNSLGNNGFDFAHILVEQMTNAVKTLYASNVRKIVCAGVVPLGCAPHALLLESGGGGGDGDGTRRACLDEVNEVVSYYNRRLEGNIAAMDRHMGDARVIFCDVYQAVMEFINHPHKYGIEDVRNACCGVVRGGEMSGCVSTEMACREASSHLWWDLYNPTPAVNTLLAHSAWSSPSLCRPFSLKHML
ncbi:GDSL esterase/lipase At1g71250-like [Salvia miltiorrhiza]|uniref:GDSL esterase/lipase At1g71250-like n=1 Tax=Salvia miltiorrhiza TaxID=226208 RepID=UPI0025AC9A24|nr:GDSL esterase/lipase At1g71250-like [Salvia miltiorrhiza]